MKVEKNTNKSNKDRYPVVVTINGVRILIPQQKKFGSYTSAHGCSVTAASMGLQAVKKKQSDGTVWNPAEVASFAKKHIGGYNGSKLTIYGSKTVINKICGKNRAFWYSNNGKRNQAIINHIKRALNNGHIVLFEQKGPIHTVVFLSYKNGKVLVASNGKTYWSRLAYQVKEKALHGRTGAANQTNWFKGSEKGAGYVVVR